MKIEPEFCTGHVARRALTEARCKIQAEPQFCNEKRTATKKAFKRASFISIGYTPEATEQVAQTQMPFKIFLFRCGSFFVAGEV